MKDNLGIDDNFIGIDDRIFRDPIYTEKVDKELYYTYIKGQEYIKVGGEGNDSTNVKNLKWTSSKGACGVLKQINEIKSGYSPKVGFILFNDYKNNIEIQIAKLGSIYKDGWRFGKSTLSNETEINKMQSKKRIYIKASENRKAHYRMQIVGRKEIESKKINNLWEISKDQLSELVKSNNKDDIILRKKIFRNLPKAYQFDWSPETMNSKLHQSVITAIVLKNPYVDFDTKDKKIPENVKKDYPILFKDVPFNFKTTGDKKIDDSINETLKEIKSGIKNFTDSKGIENMVIEHCIGSFHHEIPIKYDDSINDKEKKLIDLGVNDISTLISPKLLEKIKESKKYIDEFRDVKIRYVKEMGRSTYHPGYNTINLGKSVINTDKMQYKQGSICHEYGHAIEEMVPKIKKLCNKFLDKRTAGEKEVSLNTISSSYRDDEYTKVDNFIDPYIGCQYNDKSTELLSMGMGYLTNSYSIGRLYEKDPEYLGFIVSILSGKIGIKEDE